MRYVTPLLQFLLLFTPFFPQLVFSAEVTQEDKENYCVCLKGEIFRVQNTAYYWAYRYNGNECEACNNFTDAVYVDDVGLGPHECSLGNCIEFSKKSAKHGKKARRKANLDVSLERKIQPGFEPELLVRGEILSHHFAVIQLPTGGEVIAKVFTILLNRTSTHKQAIVTVALESKPPTSEKPRYTADRANVERVDKRYKFFCNVDLVSTDIRLLCVGR